MRFVFVLWISLFIVSGEDYIVVNFEIVFCRRVLFIKWMVVSFFLIVVCGGFYL